MFVEDPVPALNYFWDGRGEKKSGRILLSDAEIGVGTISIQLFPRTHQPNECW